MGLLATFFVAAMPVSKVLITCAFGAYLGHPSVNILTKDARKVINVLVFIAFTPALVFSKLATTVTYANIISWWYMPLNIVLCFAFGTALGMLVVKYTNVPPHLQTLTLACCAAGNTGNVPLVLVPTICNENGSPFGRSDVCSRNAVAYVSYGLWTGIVLTWTFIYKLLQPPGFQKPSAGAGSGWDSHAASPIPSCEFGEFQTGAPDEEMEDFNPRGESREFTSNISKGTGFSRPPSIPPPPNYQVSRNVSPRPPISPSSSAVVATTAPDAFEDPKAFFLYIVEKYDLKTVCTPPATAAFCGLLVGAVGPLQYLFNGPFLVFTESVDIIGQAMIPAMNMVLGASLIQGGGISELEMPSIIGIILVRLVALPIVGMMVTKIVNDLGMLPPDPLFRFVLLLQLTMPTAINIGTLAQLFSVGEKEAAIVLLYSYVSSAFFITFWVIIYLQYIV